MAIARTASIAVVLAFSFAVAASPASAAPQGPWVQPPADLSVVGENASSPQIAVAADGTATAVWRRYDGTNQIVQVATRPPGSPFAAPDDLSVAGGNTNNPQITTAPDGTATVVWQRSNGSNYIIQAATRPPGGSFAAPVDLSVVGQDANYFPQVAIAPDGTATVVWQRSDGSNWIIQAATRAPGGSFAVPVDLSTAGENAYDPQVDTAPDGTTTAVWQRHHGSTWAIQAATLPAGGVFGAPVDLSATGENTYKPQINTAPDGTTTAVWYRFDGISNVIQAATRPPGDSFAAPIDLSITGGDANSPQIAIAADGTATVVWSRYNGGSILIQAATRPPGGSFAAPVALSVTGHNASLPQIATAPDGSATAVWYRNNSSNDIIQSISTAQPSPLLGVSTAGSGSGTVTSAPSGIDCGADCAENYLSFTKVTLTATPGSGSMFKSWGGACKGASGNTCQVTVLDDATATANFGKPKLKVTKAKPAKPKVKPGKTVKLKVTAKNTGDGTAKNAKLCVNLNKSVKKALKPKGRTCQKMGSIGAGKTKTKAFKLKATGKAKKGKGYKVTFKLTANGAKANTRAVRVKVK